MAKRKTIAVPPQTRAMLARVVAKLKPPPAMTLSQWADKERRLSQGASALPGRWRTDKAPYQRGMMDAISDPHVRKVVVKSCAQIGKTDALVLNTIGYYMNYNPSPIMVLQPTLDMRKQIDYGTFLRSSAPLWKMPRLWVRMCRKSW